MSRLGALIVDDFYPDPERIRGLALSLSFKTKEGAGYPGREAFAEQESWEAESRRIAEFIPATGVETSGKSTPFLQGKFRLALASDANARPDGVHQDQQPYSAIVYLSRDRDCRGGVGLFRCRLSGERRMTPAWMGALRVYYHLDEMTVDERIATLKRHFANFDNWEQYGELPMAFNRLVILMARCFHASNGIFGETPEAGRLTQHFEFFREGTFGR